MTKPGTGQLLAEAVRIVVGGSSDVSLLLVELVSHSHIQFLAQQPRCL